MSIRSLDSIRTVRHLKYKTGRGEVPVSKIIMLALLVLAAYFYYRAMTPGGEHATQTERHDEPATGNASSVALDHPEGNNALVPLASATAETPMVGQTSEQEDKPDPKLVQSLNTIIDSSTSFDVETKTGLMPVPAPQIDLIKQVFAPELLKDRRDQ